MTTLRELLQLPRFSEIQVLNSEANLDVAVTSIEITETPDIALYIPKNVLILSTAMIFKNKQEELIPFIDSLIKAKAVGLGIKIARFLQEIDPKVIAYANEKKFALLTIPGAYPLGSLLHQMQNFLWDSKEEEINYAMDIQRTFSGLVIGDANLTHFTNELGKFIKTPVLLMNPFFKPLAHSRHFQHAKDYETHLADEIWRHLQGIQTEQDSFIVRTIKGEEVHVAVYPIKVFSYFPHYLVIVSPEKIPFPISSFAIEQAALVLSFVLFKNLKVKESEQSLQNSILKKFVESNSGALTQANAKLLEMGTSLRLLDSSHNQIILIHPKTLGTLGSKIKYDEEKMQLVLQWFQTKLTSVLAQAPVMYSTNNNNIIFLLQEKVPNLEIELDKIASEIEVLFPIAITFYFGGSYDSLEKVSDSFIEAEMTQSATRQLVETPRMNHFQPQGLKQLFNADDKEAIYYFTTSVLNELAYPEDESGMELQKTLKQYLDNQSQITKTSEDLFIHRNTVKYRIERCEEILGKKLTDPIVSLNVRLALELVNLDK
ncbi:MAG: PucR family transcriptional regulator [Lactobacillales bacterium]|nr:PucR family transcriptional regulator [Lactobacillales bacterium]